VGAGPLPSVWILDSRLSSLTGVMRAAGTGDGVCKWEEWERKLDSERRHCNRYGWMMFDSRYFEYVFSSRSLSRGDFYMMFLDVGRMCGGVG
jgi:hypothetical protein